MLLNVRMPGTNICGNHQFEKRMRWELIKRGRTVERPLVGDVVHEQYTHSAAVIRGSDGPEALLAGSIPLCH